MVRCSRPLEPLLVIVTRHGLSGISNGRLFDAYGNVFMFIYNSVSYTIKVVLKEYETCDPFEQLGNSVNHFEHPQRHRTLQLLRLISTTIFSSNC